MIVIVNDGEDDDDDDNDDDDDHDDDDDEIMEIKIMKRKRMIFVPDYCTFYVHSQIYRLHPKTRYFDWYQNILL